MIGRVATEDACVGYRTDERAQLRHIVAWSAGEPYLCASLGGPAKCTFRGLDMEGRMRQVPRGSVSSEQLGALLDQLVAVQMDLEPICGLKGARAPVVLARDVIASACEVLHAAIADLGKIVRQVDGLIDLPEAAAAKVSDRSKKQESSHDAP